MSTYEVITEKQAQEEHESLRHSKKRGEQHSSSSWKDCGACKHRLTVTKTKVIR